RTPAASLTACDAADGRARRQAVLAGQILCDTVSEMAHHPLRGARLLLSDPVYFLGVAGRGLFGKRLALRLLGPPGPVAGCGAPACCGLPEEDLRPAMVRLYPGPDDARAALEQVIDGAACRIDVMMF